MSVFLTPDQKLRAGWKFVSYVVFFLFIIIVTSAALSMVAAPTSLLSLLAINDVTWLVPAVVAMWFTVTFADHRPLRAFGIGFLPHWRRDLFFGLSLSAGMLAVLIVGCYAVGYVSMRWTGRQVSPGVLIATFGLLLLAALNEELIFRGFPLQILIEAIGTWPAIIGFSLLFGAMHLYNPNATLLGVVNTVVAGILLSLAYVKTRSLWLPYAIHVGWNVGLGFVFGFPLSGVDIASLWTTGTAGSETILGGGYGPEGGILGTFIFAAAAVIVNKHGSINPIETRAGGGAGRHHRP